MQVSTSQFFRSQTEQLQNLQADTIELQQKIATGKAIEVASQDPVSFSDIGRMRGQIANIEQYSRNILRANEKLIIEDNVLTQAITSMIRIQELAIYASNDTLNAGDRKAISTEVALLQDMLIDLANTKDATGSSLFGGYVSSDALFQKDLDGNVQYFGDDNEIFSAIGDNIKININSSGTDTFMRIPTTRSPSGESVFQIVRDTIDALQRGEAPLSIGKGLEEAIDHLTQRQTVAGTKLSRLQSQEESLESFNFSAKSILSGIEDTNIEDVISRLKQKLLSLEAAQASFVKITEQSLFNYLR
jgi:flagellar hook-associated protein 3 FlgL